MSITEQSASRGLTALLGDQPLRSRSSRKVTKMMMETMTWLRRFNLLGVYLYRSIFAEVFSMYLVNGTFLLTLNVLFI